MSKLRDDLRSLYFALYKLASKHRCVDLLEKSYDAAEAGERRHRKGRPAGKESVDTAAKYFACKWTLEHHPSELLDRRCRKSFTQLDAARLRLDCLYGQAVCVALGELPNDLVAPDLDSLVERFRALNVDYSRDIIGEP